MANRSSPGLFAFILMIVIFINCHENKGTEKNMRKSEPIATLKDMKWIIGTWQLETSRGTMYERWKMVNDSLWEGKGYRVAETDTMILEELSLEIIDDEVFYVPVVPHNEGAVYFKMIEKYPDKVVFENPEHDFPQRIIYMRMPNDSLHAIIEGMNKGIESGADFYFKRIN